MFVTKVTSARPYTATVSHIFKRGSYLIYCTGSCLFCFSKKTEAPVVGASLKTMFYWRYFGTNSSGIKRARMPFAFANCIIQCTFKDASEPGMMRSSPILPDLKIGS